MDNETKTEELTVLDSVKKYALLVQEMRVAQKNYFEATKAKYAGSPAAAASMPIYLKQSKALEKAVDRETTEIILGQTQGNLF